jgi:hypothetical protein
VISKGAVPVMDKPKLPVSVNEAQQQLHASRGCVLPWDHTGGCKNLAQLGMESPRPATKPAVKERKGLRMNVSPKVICLIAAIIFFAIAAFFGYFIAPDNRYARFSPLAIGLFFYALKDAVN